MENKNDKKQTPGNVPRFFNLASLEILEEHVFDLKRSLLPVQFRYYQVQTEYNKLKELEGTLIALKEKEAALEKLKVQEEERKNWKQSGIDAGIKTQQEKEEEEKSWSLFVEKQREREKKNSPVFENFNKIMDGIKKKVEKCQNVEKKIKRKERRQQREKRNQSFKEYMEEQEKKMNDDLKKEQAGRDDEEDREFWAMPEEEMAEHVKVEKLILTAEEENWIKGPSSPPYEPTEPYFKEGSPEEEDKPKLKEKPKVIDIDSSDSSSDSDSEESPEV